MADLVMTLRTTAQRESTGHLAAVEKGCGRAATPATAGAGSREGIRRGLVRGAAGLGGAGAGEGEQREQIVGSAALPFSRTRRDSAKRWRNQSGPLTVAAEVAAEGGQV